MLAKQGRNLVLVARREEKLKKLKEELQKEYDIVIQTYDVDVQDASAVEKMFADLAGTHIDVLVNNAGLALGKDRFEDTAFSDIETMISTNITGFLKVAQCAIPHLKKSKGHIVNVSSVSGKHAYEGGHVYCGTKAFVNMLSKSLRLELKEHSIRVTDIAPGKVETEFSKVRYKGDEKKADAEYEGWTPLVPRDIAECIGFAVSRPSHVNIDYMLVMPTEQ